MRFSSNLEELQNDELEQSSSKMEVASAKKFYCSYINNFAQHRSTMEI